MTNLIKNQSFLQELIQEMKRAKGDNFVNAVLKGCKNVPKHCKCLSKVG